MAQMNEITRLSETQLMSCLDLRICYAKKVLAEHDKEKAKGFFEMANLST